MWNKWIYLTLLHNLETSDSCNLKGISSNTWKTSKGLLVLVAATAQYIWYLYVVGNEWQFGKNAVNPFMSIIPITSAALQWSVARCRPGVATRSFPRRCRCRPADPAVLRTKICLAHRISVKGGPWTDPGRMWQRSKHRRCKNKR